MLSYFLHHNQGTLWLSINQLSGTFGTRDFTFPRQVIVTRLIQLALTLGIMALTCCFVESDVVIRSD